MRSMIRGAVSCAAIFIALAPWGGSLASQAVAATASQAPRPARDLLREASARAAAEHKNVLVKFSASWCGPCHAFDRFLADTTGVGAIMSRHFVILGLTIEEFPPNQNRDNPGGVELAREMGGASSGIPFYFMLDSRGQKTGDSKAMPDKSNIGYPESAIEVESFDRLLQQTVPGMTAAERLRIRTFLDKAAGR